jgi:multiple sugar transport system permease protein
MSPNSSPSKKWFLPILLTLGAALVLLPLAIVLFTASTGVNGGWTIANYQAAWARGNFLLAFANSTLVAIAVTAFQIFTSALAGYALARFKFRGQQSVLLILLATLIIPFQILVVPIFLVLKWGHLINTYGALILPTAANGFGIFLLRQYFQTIPVGEWNDLFKPLVFTTRPELRTVQLALAEFQEQFTNDWSLLMAAVVITTLPVVVLFLMSQRQFIRGIAATGVKN